ncbi:HNH endonuclease signature motif containing protein [Mycolicibacterium sp. XJ870]
MFESDSDADLIDALSSASRAESAAIAHRFAAIGELDARRAVELAERALWTTDPFEAVAAELSAALNISRSRAGWQIRHARALRDRLPQIAAVFATGVIDLRMVAAIIARTDTVEETVWPQLDKALATQAVRWMKLSERKLNDRIDRLIAKLDPNGVRVPPAVDDKRFIQIQTDRPGTATVFGTVRAEDGAALDQRLDAVANTVCDRDPRTFEQRRTDALGPVARLQEWMPCQCGFQDCPVATEHKKAAAVVIHVLADQATLDGTSDAPGYLPGFGVQPADTIRELATTATLKPLTVPADQTDPGYRPSVALAEFIRWRDLTCRFPGCDAPAERCDTDHTVPYPAGPTHPSNTKLYCRPHHLLKTFHTGPRGWTDHQLHDGTIIFTSPTGHTYTTEPHGAALFPTLAQPTGELSLPEPQTPTTNRAIMMPTRKQTRDQDRADRINAERRQRAELNTEQQRQHQAWLAANYQPPPF